ncbi:MAG: SDR family NAD(P)-dependent oxidoreductase [Armatimonadetes bacterium]|nr:SDR family NAD(P)-dependent oxidoreductase [Armatimonadota bacterium]
MFKHAIIVGASAGIGAAIAQQLGRAGCAVALVARRSDEIEQIAAQINASAGQPLAHAYQHDVLNVDEVEGLFQEITRDLGGLDLIIFAAGVMPAVAPDEYNIQKDALILDVNVRGAFAWLNEAARRFERVKRGTIVGISSIAGDRGRRGNPAYCTSKAALNTYLESLRNRVARFGVKVVVAKPGFVDTDMTKGLPGLFWLISAERAAELILKAAKRGKKTAYIPARWRLVGTVIRFFPSFIFRRLNI